MWALHQGTRLETRPRYTPTTCFETFPFPSPSDAQREAIGTARYVRLVPVDEKAAATLKKRTLANLYNDRPAWLANAHRALDDAVFAAHGWPPSLADDELLAKLLELNLSQAPSEPAGP